MIESLVSLECFFFQNGKYTDMYDQTPTLPNMQHNFRQLTVYRILQLEKAAFFPIVPI